MALRPRASSSISFQTRSEWPILDTISGIWALAKAGPEEIIRQLFIQKLIRHYRAPQNRIVEEYLVQMGRARKRADVAVLAESGAPKVLCELKEHLDDSSFDQLQSYMVATGARYGVLVWEGRYQCLSLNDQICTHVPDLPQLGDFVPSDIDGRDRDDELDSNDILSDICRLDSVSPLRNNRFRAVLQNQEFNLTERQLFSFRTFRLEALKRGILFRSPVTQKDWDKHVCEKLRENRKDQPPEVVVEALTEANHVDDFLKECTVRVAHLEASKAELYDAYRKYCISSEKGPVGKTYFGRQILQRGYKDGVNSKGNVRLERASADLTVEGLISSGS